MSGHPSSPFANPVAVASYAEDARRKVPGLADLHRMATVLLAERASEQAHVLVVGAGGGLEIRAMGEARPAWKFTGVDPSTPMLELARDAVSTLSDRATFVEGTVDQAPEGPFDGATCLLVLHFLDRSERQHTLREICRRLKPGARIVLAHHTAAGSDPERWMTRSVAFGDRDSRDLGKAAATARVMMERLPLLTPADDESLLRETGFVDVELFYAAFSFRGWLASARRS
jgi:tRNA (cmo5U34)-methyltransferase